MLFSMIIVRSVYINFVLIKKKREKKKMKKIGDYYWDIDYI